MGKVIYTIPSVGYLLSFTQTKLGILLFILFPAGYIIIDEILTIMALLKHKKTTPLPQKINTLVLFLSLATCFFPNQPTHALLSDAVTLSGNNFALPAAIITPTPQEDCDDNHAAKSLRPSDKDLNR